MGVLVNLKTSNLEEAPDSSVAAGTHGYPLIDQQGNPSIAGSYGEMQKLLANGFTPPGQHMVQQGLQFGKFNTPGQTLAAGAEGFGKTATFGLSTKVERDLGVPAEDIMNREHYHPVAEGVGELAGLLAPGGAGGILTRAGEATAKAVAGVTGEGLAGKAVQLMAKNAVQTSMLQGSEEISHMFLGDPNQTSESAIAHMSMAAGLGAIGGAVLGSVPLAWKGAGKTLATLQDLQNKMQASTPAGLGQVTQMVADKGLSTAAGAVGAMAGHALGGPLGGVAGGFVTKYTLQALQSGLPKLAEAVGGVSPEAISGALSTALNSQAPLDAMAFHSMANYYHAAHQGQVLMDKAVDNFFDPEGEPMPKLQISAKDNEKFGKVLSEYQDEPGKLVEMATPLAGYIPDHQAAIAQVATRAVGYMKSIKPPTEPAGPFDSARSLPQAESSQYNRALGLVNRPLSILETMRAGNLTEHDMAVMEAVYPSTYQALQQKLTAGLVEAKSKGQVVPYQKRLVLSQFLKQNLDSTIGPMTMMTLMTKKPQQPQGGPGGHAGKGKGRSQTAQFGKMKTPGQDQTVTQRAEEDRITPQ